MDVFIQAFPHLKLLLAVWACSLFLQPLEDAWVTNKLRTVGALFRVIDNAEANHAGEVVVEGLRETLFWL